MTDISKNIMTAIDYMAATFGDAMSYWEREEHPEKLSMPEREAWHRDAWDREQIALKEATSGQAGNDAPGNARNFGYASPAMMHEQ